MAAITFNEFGGSIPRRAPHTLSGKFAAKAIDCYFHSGRLSAWRDTLPVTPVSSDESIWQVGCCWVRLPMCADLAIGDPLCQHIYVTGRSDYPEIGQVDQENCTIKWHRLGLPCPTRSPTAEAATIPSDGPTEDVEGRSYVYQYVNSLGQRSAVSPSAEPLMMADGTQAVISGWEIPDATWGITHVRIYRSVSGLETGREAANEDNTTYMLAGEVPIGAGVFVDAEYNVDLYEALEEDIVLPPPENLQGIINIGSNNTLVGYLGSQLFFSENNNYHNWPHVLTLDDNITGIAENNGVVYVLTDGSPYSVVAEGDCRTAACRTVVRHFDAYPLMGCGNRKIAKLPMGIVYPSSRGLVSIMGRSGPQVLTTPLYSQEEWGKLQPHSMVLGYANSHLFAFADGGAFVVSINQGPESGWELDFHTNLSDKKVTYALTTRTGMFHIVKNGQLHKWGASPEKRTYTWESPEIVIGVPINFAAAKTYHEDGTLRVAIRSDDRDIIDRDVLTPKQFALPLWGTGSRFQITLEGNADVSLFTMSTGVKELSS